MATTRPDIHSGSNNIWRRFKRRSLRLNRGAHENAPGMLQDHRRGNPVFDAFPSRPGSWGAPRSGGERLTKSQAL
jgi:hypothetical protein